MRPRIKVAYKQYIPIEFEGRPRQMVEGTGKHAEGYPNIGYFHKWVNIPPSTSLGEAFSAVAIVERPDGTIIEVPSIELKFLRENETP